jgi:hypothetical protein
MDSAQVIRSYYEAFGALDHQRMDAAVMGKAGKKDIEMVTNFFVISRVRQAYEQNISALIPAQEWRDSGSPPVSSPVFGVSDLVIEKIAGDEGEEKTQYSASYILWLPASPPEEEAAPAPAGDGAEPDTPALPQGYPYTDYLTLIRHNGDWRITEIIRSPTGS